jgi:hypothetical protein
MLGGEGGTIRELMSVMSLSFSESFGNLANLFNFGMQGLGMDLINGMMGVAEQGKQMVEKIISYITQAVQVVVDAWTNREDYLYNFL